MRPPLLLLPLLLRLLVSPDVASAADDDDRYSLAGVHLTIVTVEDPPFIQVRDNPLGPIKPWNEWGGWVVEIIKLLSAESGFTYTLQLPTGSNTFAYGAADKDVQTRHANYTRHTLEGKGGVGTAPDVLFAGAYITVPRLTKTNMTAPYSAQPLSLLVQEPDDTKDNYFRFGLPFTWDLWITIAAAILVSSITFVLLEGSYYHSPDFQAKAFDDFWSFCKAVSLSTFLSASSFTGIHSWTPVTKLGKIYSVLWGFTILIVVSSFTASSASFLIAGQTSYFARTFNAFLSPELRVCVLKNSAYANYLSRHEKYKYFTQVGCQGLMAMAKGLSRGECDGIIERRMHLEYLQSAASKRTLKGEAATANGRKFVVQESLFDGPQELSAMFGPSIPLRTRNVLSHWLIKLVSDGSVTALYKTHVAMGEAQMQELTSNNLDRIFGATVQAVTLTDMAGLFFIYAAVVVLVVVAKLYAVLTHWYNLKSKHRLEDWLEHMAAGTEKLGTGESEWRLERESDIPKIIDFWVAATMEETRRKQLGDGNRKSHHLQEMNQAVYLYVRYQLNDAVLARRWKDPVEIKRRGSFRRADWRAAGVVSPAASRDTDGMQSVGGGTSPRGLPRHQSSRRSVSFPLAGAALQGARKSIVESMRHSKRIKKATVLSAKIEILRRVLRAVHKGRAELVLARERLQKRKASAVAAAGKRGSFYASIRLTQLMKKVSLFESAPDHLVDMLSAKLKPVAMLPGAIIMTQGAKGDCMYFIKSGEVDILVDGQLVATLGRRLGSRVLARTPSGIGDASSMYFGEMALVNDDVRTATVRAKTEVELLRLDRAEFAQGCRQYPEFGEAVQQTAMARAGEDATKRTASFSLAAEPTSKPTNKRQTSAVRFAAMSGSQKMANYREEF